MELLRNTKNSVWEEANVRGCGDKRKGTPDVAPSPMQMARAPVLFVVVRRLQEM